MSNLVNPPKHLKLFPPNTKWKQNVIDYTMHSSYFVGSKASLYMKLSVIFKFHLFFIINLVKRLIKYELIPLNIRNGKTIFSKLKFIKYSLKNAVGLSKKKFLNYEKNDVAKSMDLNGCAVVKFSEKDFEELENVSKEYFQKLEDRRNLTDKSNRNFEESRSYANRDDSPKLFQVIEKIFEKSGVLLGASYQLGRDVKLIDVNPQINDKSDSFWSEIFTDNDNMEFPDAAYFHRDASGGDLKAIIYLSDVGNDNGPFTFSIGSHKMSISKIDDWICETNDSCGFSSTEKSLRLKFSNLPKTLRQKGSFGNDLDNKSDFTRDILNSAWKITSKKGSIVLFDTKGAHRGGMVLKGKRKVITCVLG